MPSKKQADPRLTRSETMWIAAQQGKALFEDGLRKIDLLPDGPRKTWVLAVEKNREDAKLLMKELHRNYPGIEWPEQLAHLGVQYSDAVPILLHWLPKIDNPDIKAAITTLLGQKWIGRVGIDAIAESISTTVMSYQQSGVRDADLQIMMNALVNGASDDDLLYVAKIGMNPKLPHSARMVLIYCLGGRRSKSGAEALIELMPAADERQSMQIVKELSKNRSAVARKYLENLQQDSVSSMRDGVNLSDSPKRARSGRKVK